MRKFNKELSQKVAYYSLLIWCSLPILIMAMNPIIKGTSTVYFYMFMLGIGIIGVINGFLYFYHNKELIKKISMHNKIPFILILVFLIWTFISCLFAKNKGLSLIGSGYRHEGFLTYICYLGFFLNALIISSNKECIKKCFKMLIISSTLLGICVLIGNNIFITGSNNYEPNIEAAIFSNENHYAYYLTITILLALFFTIYEHSFYSISFLLLSFVLMKNNTFGSYLAVLLTLILVFIYFLIKKEKRLLVSLLFILFICISLINPNVTKNFKSITMEITNIYEHKDDLQKNIYIENDNADEEVVGNTTEDGHSSYLLLCAGNSRLDLWLKGLKLANKKPLFGYGLENLFDPYYDVLVCHKTDRPHNMFVQILMTTGYIGLGLIVSFLVLLFYKFIKNIRKLNKYIVISFGTIICYLISAFFGNSMFYTTPYFILIVGFICSIFLRETEKEL